MCHFKLLSLLCITLVAVNAVSYGFPIDGSEELDGCEVVQGDSGTIKYSSPTYHESPYTRCWKISVPKNKFANLEFKELSLGPSNCDIASITFRVSKGTEREETAFCSSNDKKPMVFFDNVLISYYRMRRTYYQYTNGDKFEISYVKEDILCRRMDSFRCGPSSCIASEKVCDGEYDCDNGADEIGCETGVFAVDGVSEMKESALEWLISQRNDAWGWRENTHRAVIALYLAGGANFNGSNKDDDLTAKQLELQLTTTLLRNATARISPTQLSMYINALLVICHDPSKFYGYNLIQLLKDTVDAPSSSYQHPLSYLTLCNAGVIPNKDSVRRLINILQSSSEQSFLTDLQAMAVMALSCITEDSFFFHLKQNVTLMTKKFKNQQMGDGSFGNIYTTALVIQALLANGHEDDKDWKLKAAIEYLKKQQSETDNSFGDFLATHLVLPILNRKSLIDVANVNCTANLNRPRDGNPVSDIENKMSPKISIRYFLYIGDKKDIVHQISLRVPDDITVLEMMRLAANVDPKYEFKFRESGNNVYVYEIGGIANDPEDGKFWLLHLAANTTTVLMSKSPNQVTLGDEEDVVMWYKSTKLW